MSLAESISQLRIGSGPEHEMARQQFARFIQKKGLKQTQQRALVLEVFLGISGHLTVQELADQMKTHEPNIGLTTVYRTLRLLVESGVAEERHFTDGQARFEVAKLGTHHDHLICTVCGNIFEFEDDEIEARQNKIATDRGMTIRRHRHEIYAECDSPNNCPNNSSTQTSSSS